MTHRASRALGRFSRRGFLVKAAVVGAALATDPRSYVLKAQDAYATICGPGNTFAAGWTVFCCTVNKGVNACPPGTFSAGWWKAADSSWCCGGYRYIVDCNATCTSCTSGCTGDHICDSRCWSCSCSKGPSTTCDQRRHCCNAFRYGQCNTQVRCSGGVACRVVSCVPPYKWDSCSTTTLVDNRTAEHGAPCLQGCGAILTRYDAIGANGSFLGGSTGPERAVGDGVGRYVDYQHGSIYWTKTTGARVVHGASLRLWHAAGGPRGELGYPDGEQVTHQDGAWVQLFQHGLTCDTAHTYASVVSGWRYTVWARHGRESGVLGYANGPLVTQPDGSWAQTFQHGVICDSPHTSTSVVYGDAWTTWVGLGREKGVLGFPHGDRATHTDGSWLQVFDHGDVCAAPGAPARAVTGAIWVKWLSVGREGGTLGYPAAPSTKGVDGRGVGQRFAGGEIWTLGTGPGRVVTGRVLARWRADGAEAGSWGYPLSDTVTETDGTQHAQFEHGTITA